MRVQARSLKGRFFAGAALAGLAAGASAEAPTDQFWAGLEYFYPTISSTAALRRGAPGSGCLGAGRDLAVRSSISTLLAPGNVPERTTSRYTDQPGRLSKGRSLPCKSAPNGKRFRDTCFQMPGETAVQFPFLQNSRRHDPAAARRGRRHGWLCRRWRRPKISVSGRRSAP